MLFVGFNNIVFIHGNNEIKGLRQIGHQRENLQVADINSFIVVIEKKCASLSAYLP